MPRGSYLVNTARGGLVQPEAIRWALEEGILEGVALDVLPEEPPSPELLALLNHPKVILTPHLAWYSEASERELRRLAALNVLHWAQTGRPLYPVREVSHG
jgi:D-3-phosphoglycerate dehydrogenase